MIEGVNIEFKEIDRKTGAIPPSVSKEVAAFANSEGGELFIGVDDEGTVVGVPDADDIMKRLSSVINDSILPNVMPFVQIRPAEMEGKSVVKTTVSVGTERPYYLAKEGLKPKGVYVRKGSTSIPLSESGIREMILETSGKSFEESRSLTQELTFQTFQQEMERKSLEYGENQMRRLKIIGEDGLYTNLAYLLSDQCPYTIKTAIFQGTDNAVFRDRREFRGSLLKQLEDCYAFLDMNNKTKASFSGLRRTDQRDYPAEAIREALLNSIIHRDYLFSGSTIINVFDDHIEFVSLGGLLRGLSLEAIFLGASQSRTPQLADVFYRLELVESFGTGIRKIMRLYTDQENKPVFRTAEGAFTVTMPNRNFESRETAEQVSITVSDKTDKDELLDEIYQYAREQGSLTRKDVEMKYGFGSTKAYKMLLLLCEEGKLIQRKYGKQTKYDVVR